jgi:hypothetical protein
MAFAFTLIYKRELCIVVCTMLRVGPGTGTVPSFSSDPTPPPRLTRRIRTPQESNPFLALPAQLIQLATSSFLPSLSHNAPPLTLEILQPTFPFSLRSRSGPLCFEITNGKVVSSYHLVH